MNIAIGADHGGYARKEELKQYLESAGYAVTDFGCYSTESIDYPDYGFPVAEAVAAGKFDRGILICTTGIGMCIAANKVRGIRCALCVDTVTADLTRRHNDSNVLALGAKTVSSALAKEIATVWLTTEYEGGRHARRVGKITDYENNR